MLLSARMLKDVAGVNAYGYATEVAWTEGDTVDVYFQLIDSSKDLPGDGFSPGGRRYIPNTPATLVVKINSIDSTKSFTKTATQPFGDPSIWKISIAPGDGIVGTRDLVLVLTEAGVVRNGRIKGAINVNSINESF